MADEIRFQRGPLSRLPLLDNGEPVITTEGEFFIGTPSGNVQFAKKSDITGLKQEVADIGTNIKTLGAAGNNTTDDTAYFQQAASVNTLHLPYGSYRVTSLPVLPNFIKSDQATLLISGKHDFSSPLFSGSINGKLTIKGQDVITMSVSNIEVTENSTFTTEYYSGDFRSAKYQRLTLTLNITSVEVGDVVVINNIDAIQFLGAYEVVAVNGASVEVIGLSQYTLASSAVTGTGYVIKTVFRFLGNKTSFIAENSSTLDLENIALLGDCFPYDYNGRGNNYDPAGNKGGSSGIIARNSSQLTLTNSVVTGFRGSAIASNDVSDVLLENSAVSCGGRNGIVGASASKVTTNLGTVIANNLLDGIISQDSSFVFATNTRSIGNGRHGFITAGNAVINVTNANASFNGYLDLIGNGVEANSSLAIAIGLTAYKNSNAGLRALGNGMVRATSVNVTENSVGVSAETQSQITVSGTVNLNTLNDLLASGGSFILASGTTYTKLSPVPNTHTPDGSFIQTVSSVADIRFSANGTNAAAIINIANQLLLGFGSAVAGISARQYVSGNLLAKGDLYLAGDDGKYYKLSVVGGALTVTPTAVSTT